MSGMSNYRIKSINIYGYAHQPAPVGSIEIVDDEAHVREMKIRLDPDTCGKVMELIAEDVRQSVADALAGSLKMLDNAAQEVKEIEHDG
jgi:hypothetical protein